MSTINVAAIKADFPILSTTVRGGHRLVYLDSGATSQKPSAVLDAERSYYEQHNAAVHRGAHALAELATEDFEAARVTIAGFVGARAKDLVFTKNATESLNLVSYAFSNATALNSREAGSVDPRFVLQPGDSIVITEMEHHANIIPWQEVCRKTGATLRWIPLTDEGRLDLTHLDELIDDTTKVVSVVHQSNILGTINPVEMLMDRAHAVGAIGIIDGCQSVPHMSVDVHSLGADLFAWSGHKMLGPTGIGCLWGTEEILEAMPPFLTGGSMIQMVEMEKSTFAPPPQKFEAGTPVVAQAVALAVGARYLEKLGMNAVAEHEYELTEYTVNALNALTGVRIIGPANARDRGSAVSFIVDGLHPHDVGQVLDSRGVAVRVGHHCAWPTCRRFGVPSTTRISPYIYNDTSDIDDAIDGIVAAQEFFGVK